jgi:hypothetical protein
MYRIMGNNVNRPQITHVNDSDVRGHLAYISETASLMLSLLHKWSGRWKYNN